MSWAQGLLDVWFGLQPEQWWKVDPDLDEQLRESFLETWEEQRQGLAEDFLTSPEEALAAVILFDQLPRNFFRGHAESFATDHLALAIAKAAIARGLDKGMPRPRRSFFYMPFQHSEDIDDQRQSLVLFAELGDEEQLRFARLHHDIIERFGRFPHRNAILGRTPRADEIAAGDVVPW
jgi:uncharacterized protein (DUF924 family)